MANLNTQSFAQIVSNFATAVQGRASKLVDFTIGSVLRAIAEAMGGVSLWLQGLALQVGALTRAATSNGTDLDSWFAQFGFARLPAVAATGQESFARYTPTNQALVPVGATVQTQDGSVLYTVVADATNAAYSAAQGGYVLPPGQASVNVTVQCTVAGAIGNVSAGAVNTLGTAISGVDYVTNAAAFQNGVPAEKDAPARARFVLYIASLESATLLAVKNAIASVGLNITGIITENQQYNGSTQNGYFTVIADDGTGYPSSTTLTNVANAVEAVRPLCSTYGVHGPTILTAAVSMAITTGTGYTHSAVAAQVAADLQAYINGLGDGVQLPWAYLSTVAFDVEGVTNVANVLLNGGTADIVPTPQQRVLAGVITVT
ncbi:baseplate J/gp47 family protein [Cupriavidus basilensis]|uniref:Uncharacterized protein n=1 Tax=Cupriavidus basilensis TaxID=68895 RepID=A0A0C4Y1V6_9BURK|nr:baseplate J/gp47 family protein [Cupriavidus basilensis]AJG19082.1 hypothetical protein RR42_m1685 [Cupriavidus basilensis]